MSQIEHHPTQETLLSYAAGSLPASLALVVGCHLQYCQQCRSGVSAGEALGAGLMVALSPQALSSRARESVLARLDEQGADEFIQEPKSVLVSRPQGSVPRLLQGLLQQDNLDALPWKRTIAPGLKQIVLNCGEGDVRLLRISAGKKMPVHSHGGSELTMILRGGYSDNVGKFNMGDVADLESSVEHQPMADSDEDCICLAGMDAPLVFKGWLARLIQPIVGM
ncbi:MAG: ChrR family anti-sigma-E factor [Zhongshania sp.]|uniref:ChrR family anti-sigma-E factor n=1 Tax=Zhongshania sp. TaxID=1971902 RepID=UPI00262721C9|nr:ChrR family anti-sigma-E factor [Zhongshania sp.]MDF1691853.1 ChrR family anti-sigma-E factor [Zhongshania sp.]